MRLTLLMYIIFSYMTMNVALPDTGTGPIPPDTGTGPIPPDTDTGPVPPAVGAKDVPTDTTGTKGILSRIVKASCAVMEMVCGPLMYFVADMAQRMGVSNDVDQTDDVDE